MFIVAAFLLTSMIASVHASIPGPTVTRVLLDKDGGSIELRAAHADDKTTRDAARQQLKDETRLGIADSALQQYAKELHFRYEDTLLGGRIRITTKNIQARTAVQEFLRSQMRRSNPDSVAFDYVTNTSLIVLPVNINKQGPYRFLLDTGASNTILSTVVADKLQIPTGPGRMLLTGGGNIPVTMRTIQLLQAGSARLEDIEIAVGNFELMKTMKVDGILGSDYLRRFKISIDYDHQLVNIESCCPKSAFDGRQPVTPDSAGPFPAPLLSYV